MPTHYDELIEKGVSYMTTCGALLTQQDIKACSHIGKCSRFANTGMIDQRTKDIRVRLARKAHIQVIRKNIDNLQGLMDNADQSDPNQKRLHNLYTIKMNTLVEMLAKA